MNLHAANLWPQASTFPHQREAVDEILSTPQRAKNLKLVTVEVPEPEGYELTGEHRTPELGEIIVALDGTPHEVNCFDHDFLIRRKAFILRKKWEAPVGFPTNSWVYQAPSGNNEVTVRADALAHIFGGEFTPPPVQKIQVKR
jgi:hypothetical protein